MSRHRNVDVGQVEAEHACLPAAPRWMGNAYAGLMTPDPNLAGPNAPHVSAHP